MSIYYACSGFVKKEFSRFLTDAVIWQLFEDGSQRTVGSIHDKYEFLDLRQLKLSWSDGSLSFGAIYDTPLVFHQEDTFFTSEGKEAVRLHQLLVSGQTYLEYQGSLFQVTKKEIRKGARWDITVYNSAPIESGSQIAYQMMAEIIVRQSQNQILCNIRIDAELPMELRMAIVSLPFTLLLVPDPQ